MLQGKNPSGQDPLWDSRRAEAERSDLDGANLPPLRKDLIVSEVKEVLRYNINFEAHSKLQQAERTLWSQADKLAAINSDVQGWKLYLKTVDGTVISPGTLKACTQHFASLSGRHLTSADWAQLARCIKGEENYEIGQTIAAFREVIDLKLSAKQWSTYCKLTELAERRRYSIVTVSRKFCALMKAGLPDSTCSVGSSILQRLMERGSDLRDFNRHLRFYKQDPGKSAVKTYQIFLKSYLKSGPPFGEVARQLTMLDSSRAWKEEGWATLLKMGTHYVGKDWRAAPLFEELKSLREHCEKLAPQKFAWDSFDKAVKNFISAGLPLRAVIRNFVNFPPEVAAQHCDAVAETIKYTRGTKSVYPVTEFLDKHGDPAIVELFGKMVKYCAEKGWEMRRLTKSLDILSDQPSLKPAEWSELARLSAEYQREGRKLEPLLVCYQQFQGVMRKYPQLESRRDVIFKKANEVLADSITRPDLPLKKVIAQLAVHEGIVSLLREKDPVKQEQARALVQNLGKGDTLPFALKLRGTKKQASRPNPEAQDAYRQTREVYARSFDLHYGFGALTIEAARPPDREPALLARFGYDVAQSCKYVNAKDVNAFPGRGFLISGIIPEKVFVDLEADAKDPFAYFKENIFPWAANEFDSLNKAHFLFTRGLIAVSCPGEAQFRIGAVDYSYVIFNEHFHRQPEQIAALVPTALLREKLKGRTIAYEDYVGFEPQRGDINDEPLTLRDFMQEAEELPSYVINLGWGSNIGGGLCNAFAPGKFPYFEWERDRRGETKDIWGHIHKSHILGVYSSVMTPPMDKALQPLREAHAQVYSLASGYQNLFDLFRISQSFWHKGYTVDRKFDLVEEDLEQQPLEEDDGEEGQAVNPHSFRMLEEAYRWHAGDKQQPILCLAPVLDYWNIPKSPFWLDTRDMTLRFGERVIQLPPESDGRGEEEQRVWMEEVMPLWNTSNDLRFYQREDLGA